MKNDISEYKKKIGKSKKQIIEILGQEFNYYHDNLWIYKIDESWWGGKEVLLLFFDDQEVLTKIIIKKYFFYIRT